VPSIPPEFVEENHSALVNVPRAAMIPPAGDSAEPAHAAGPCSTIEQTVRRCSQTEPVRDARGNAIEGKYTFDAKNVLRGCELLGRHLGLFKERP
jgi:hypothetical protein